MFKDEIYKKGQGPVQYVREHSESVRNGRADSDTLAWVSVSIYTDGVV